MGSVTSSPRRPARGRSGVEAALVVVTASLTFARPDASAFYAVLALLLAGLVLGSRIDPSPGAGSSWSLVFSVAGTMVAGLVPRVGLALVAVGLLLRALPPWREARVRDGRLADPLPCRAVAVSGLIALALGFARSNIALGLAGPLVFEAFGPGARWTRGDAGRRGIRFVIAAGVALLEGREGSLGVRAGDFLLFFLVVLALVSVFEVAARASGRPLASLAELPSRLMAWGEEGGAPVAHLLSLALAVAVLLELGVAFKVTRALSPEELVPAGGRDFLVRCFAPNSDAFSGGAASTLEVLEESRPLGPAHATHDSVRDVGLGQYSHWFGVVHLSSSDGTDPRTNGRSYALRFVPGLGPLGVMALAALCLAFNARRARRASDRLSAWHASSPWAATVCVFLCALVVRSVFTLTHAHDSLGCSLKGAPWWDAREWDALATDFSVGQRWDVQAWTLFGARRPFFYIFMGSIYTWTGPSLEVVRAAHVLLGALSATFVFETCRRLVPTPLAFLAAFVQIANVVEMEISLAPMTEPLGNCLSNAMLLALTVGVLRAEKRAWILPCALSGACLALSNLTRTLTLPAIVGVPLMLAWLRLPGGSWRRVVGAATVFVLGALGLLGPWLLRQRIVHGIWTLSDNTAEMFFSATSPLYGEWSPDVYLLLDRHASFAERAAYYNAGTSENLRLYGGWFFMHALDHAWRAVGLTTAPRGVLLATALAFVASRGEQVLAGSWVRSLGLGGFVVVVWLFPAPHFFWIAGVILALCRREPFALLLAVLLPTLASIGLTAVGGDPRFVHGLTWLGAAFGCWFVWQALCYLLDGTLAPRIEVCGGARVPFLWRALLIFVAALWVVGFGRAVVSHLSPTPPPATSVPDDEARDWIERVLKTEAGRAYAPLRGRMVVRRSRLRPGYRIRLLPGETLESWLPFQRGREDPVTILATRPSILEKRAVVPGSLLLPEGAQEVVLVGIPVLRGDSLMLGPGRDGCTLEVAGVGVAGELLMATAEQAARHERLIERELAQSWR